LQTTPDLVNRGKDAIVVRWHRVRRRKEMGAVLANDNNYYQIEFEHTPEREQFKYQIRIYNNGRLFYLGNYMLKQPALRELKSLECRYKIFAKQKSF